MVNLLQVLYVARPLTIATLLVSDMMHNLIRINNVTCKTEDVYVLYVHLTLSLVDAMLEPSPGTVTIHCSSLSSCCAFTLNLSVHLSVRYSTRLVNITHIMKRM
jgi:hypothetical protein